MSVRLLGCGYLAQTPPSAYSTPNDYGALITQGDADGEMYNDALGPVANLDTVEEWWDRYGSQTWWRFANTTSAQQPTYKTNQVNSLAAVEFDGTADRLAMPTADLWKNLTGGSIYLVIKPTLGADRCVFHATMSDGSDRVKIVCKSDGSLAVTCKRVTGDTATTLTTTTGKIVTATWHILALYFDYTNNVLDVYINGQLEATGALTTSAGTLENANSSTGPVLGATTAGATFYSGQIAYWAFYSELLTLPNAAAFVSFLGTKYNIAIS